MEEKQTKSNVKNIIYWASIVLVCLIIGIIIITFINNEAIETNLTSIELNQKNTIGKLTYYINNNWECKETFNEGSTHRYYYPSSDTMLMITISKSDNNMYNFNIDEFLEGYIDGMLLDYNDLISVNTQKINGYNFGIVRCYMDNYETLQYIMLNNDEFYIFCFGQKEKLNNQNINLTENLISNVNIKQEVTISSFVQALNYNGFNVEVEEKYASLIGAIEGCELNINGEDIEIYRFDENSANELSQKNIRTAKNGFINFLNIDIKVKYNKNLVLTNYEEHPNKAQILKIFNDL